MRIWYRGQKIFTTQTDSVFLLSIWKGGKESFKEFSSVDDAKKWIDKQN
jgi:hypothetical protein